MTNVVFHAVRTYELDGETYYLSEIDGRGFISDEGVYRLEVNITAGPQAMGTEIFEHLRDEILKFLAEKKVIPVASVLVQKQPPLDS